MSATDAPVGLSAEAQALLGRVSRAREDRASLISEDVELPLEAAYRIQRLRFAERDLVGYKLGLVSAAKQRQMGLDAPFYGPLLRDMGRSGRVDLDEFIDPRIEPEIAVVLRDDVPARVSPGALELAIGGLFLAVDVLDTVWEGYRFSAAEVVADGLSGGAFLLDEVLLTSEAGTLQLWLDGDLVGEGDIDAIGDWRANLRWLAGEVGGLRAGQVVLLGSPAAAVAARPGTLELHGPGNRVLIARLTREGVE